MPAPLNDLFANALILPATESGSDSGATRDATFEVGEPANIGTSEQGIWYLWTCPSTGWYKWTIPQAGHVFTGTFGGDQSQAGLIIFPDGTLTQMSPANAITSCYGGLNPAGTPQDFVVAAYFTEDQRYVIKAVTARSGSTINAYTCTFSINWEKFTPPANDDFANAIDLGTLPATVSATSFDSTFQLGLEVEDNADANYDREQSVWFKFTAPATGRYRVMIPVSSLTPVGHGNDFNHSAWLQVSTGTTLATFESGEIASKFFTWSGSESQERVGHNLDLVASTVYYVRLHTRYKVGQLTSEVFNKFAFDFDLEVEQWTPPANDDFANAETMSTTLPNTKSGTTYDSTEEAGEPSVPYNWEQSVWYKFTPASTGKYRFRIQKDNVAYHGDRNFGSGEASFSIKAATTVADHTFANVLSYDATVQTFDEWLNKRNIAMLVDLVAATQYNLKVTSDGGNSFRRDNEDTLDFTVDYQLVTPPSNDDFANAQAISGASGNTNFTCLGASGQTPDEPQSYYWNGGPGDDPGATVWFSWTCPASGYYKFHVEPLEIMQGGYDIAIYTGSALNALTRVANCQYNDHPNAFAPRAMTTTVGLNAVNGTVYKIQVNGWSIAGGDQAKLTWSTLTTPVGDSAAAAVTAPFVGRDNNFGHSAADPPPNFATLAAGHDAYWYFDGQASKSKWYKYTATEDTKIQITASQYLDDTIEQRNIYVEDWGIIAYKGANYASLTVAQWYNTDLEAMEDVVMLLNGSQSWDGEDYFDYASTNGDGVNGQSPLVRIDVAAGETLWVCLFGAYDGDIHEDTTWPSDDLHALEVSYDISIDYAKPPNDDLMQLTGPGTPYGYPTYEYDLRLDEYWGGDLVYGVRYSGHKDGTTYGATTQVGEQAHGGYGPTRSVWFAGGISHAGQWKFWIESPGDCTLSIYAHQNTGDPSVLVSLSEDDDSGAGTNPECLFTTTGTQELWIAVDSKTPTNFQLRWEYVSPHPSPPVNDDFDNAIDLATSPRVLRGTTVGASGEYFEISSPFNSSGPSDSVWYKWTSDRNGFFKIDGRCLTNTPDGWFIIDCFTGPDKHNLTYIGDGNYGGIYYGPNFLNSDNDIVNLPVNLGQTYYFRVMTESGGSEEFELWIDTDSVYLTLLPGGIDDQPGVDFATARLKFTPSGTEIKKTPTTDAATVYLDLQPISTFEDLENTEAATIPLKFTITGTDTSEYHPVDADTVYLKLTPSGEEDHTHLCFAGEGNPELRFYGDPFLRFESDPLTPDLRWFSHLHKGAQYC